jgi:hypothetical protein
LVFALSKNQEYSNLSESINLDDLRTTTARRKINNHSFSAVIVHRKITTAHPQLRYNLQKEKRTTPNHLCTRLKLPQGPPDLMECSTVTSLQKFAV